MYPKITIFLLKTEMLWIRPIFRRRISTSTQKRATTGQDQNLCTMVSIPSAHLSHLYDSALPIWYSKRLVAIIFVKILYCNVWYDTDVKFLFNLYTSIQFVWPSSCSQPASQVFLASLYWWLMRRLYIYLLPCLCVTMFWMFGCIMGFIYFFFLCLFSIQWASSAQVLGNLTLSHQIHKYFLLPQKSIHLSISSKVNFNSRLSFNRPLIYTIPLCFHDFISQFLNVVWFENQTECLPISSMSTLMLSSYCAIATITTAQKSLEVLLAISINDD